MGEVIHRKAARERILEDIVVTRVNAAPRAAAQPGSAWAAAEPRLEPSCRLWQATHARFVAKQAQLRPLVAARDVADDAADRLMKQIADEVWNLLGRPANDVMYELLFPGGASFYTDSPDEEQPHTMRFFAELLDADIDPRLAPIASSAAQRVRAAADALEVAAEAVRKPRAELRLLDRMLTAAARSGHHELQRLKRFWRSESISEVDIHAVIPDRPRTYGVAHDDAAPAVAPPPVAPPPVAPPPGEPTRTP